MLYSKKVTTRTANVYCLRGDLTDILTATPPSLRTLQMATSRRAEVNYIMCLGNSDDRQWSWTFRKCYT